MALPAELERAASLLREGRAEAARRILVRYLQTQPGSDTGWYLLSFAVQEPDRQVESLQRALRINPDHAKARARLRQVSESPGQVSEPPEPEAPKARPPRASLMSPQVPQAEPEGFSKRPMRRAPGSAGRRRKVVRKTSRIDARTRTIFIASASLLVVGALIGALLFANFLLGILLEPSRTQATVQAGGAAVMLPPTWTPTASKTPTATPTATSSPTPTGTPTPIPPDPTTAAEMDQIQLEVSNLRGLELVAGQPSYVVPRARVRPLLEDSFVLAGGTESHVADQARALIALGLINPTYDLYTNILNGIADGLGGFYLPWTGELFVIGTQFSGIERWIYAHEYGHALVDQQFDLQRLGIYPLCERTGDECNAIQALVEGDATLLMTQWWLQYASPTDYRDILNYNPGYQVLPEQFPPPYVGPDANFPYEQGAQFVEYLYGIGNWARVNGAYQSLPASTEQIIHPEKYLSGEAPHRFQEVEIGTLLGPEWRLLMADTLGEWTTYLILRYSADLAAQTSEQIASQAARGWGGDHYQIHYRDDLDQIVLAARWSWDSGADANEFHQALISHVGSRFRGEALSTAAGECWEVNSQVSCIYRSGQEILWLLAPSLEILEGVLAAFPSFG